MTTSETIRQQAIDSASKGLITNVPEHVYHWMKSDCKAIAKESKMRFLSSDKCGKGFLTGFYVKETNRYFISSCTKDEYDNYIPFSKMLQNREKAYHEGFFIVIGDMVLAEVTYDGLTTSEMLNISELKDRKDAIPYLLRNKEDAKNRMWPPSKKRYGAYTVVDFDTFVEEFEVEFCDLCGSINTEHDGASGDGGRYVGYQECSWLVCKACGHQGDAE